VRRAGDIHQATLPPPAIIAEALVAQPLTSASPRIIIDPPSTTGPTPEEAEALAAELAATGAWGGLSDSSWSVTGGTRGWVG
jgi:hypothetical protein